MNSVLQEKVSIDKRPCLSQKGNDVAKKTNSTELRIFAFCLCLFQTISLVLSHKTSSHGFKEAVEYFTDEPLCFSVMTMLQIRNIVDADRL